MSVDVMDQDAFSVQSGPLRDQCPECVGDSWRNLHQVIGNDAYLPTGTVLEDKAMGTKSLVYAI